MSTNTPFRFGRGRGLQIAGNEKTQAGYLRLENARIDLRDCIAKKTGSELVKRTTTDDPETEIPVADLRATYFRVDELLCETKDAIYSRELCDGALVNGSQPNGDWDRRGPWTRGQLRIEVTRDFGDVSVVQSSAALVTAPNGNGACVLQLVEIVAANGNPITVLAIQVADEHAEHIEGPTDDGQTVIVAAPGTDPHVVRVSDTLLAMTWGEGGAELFYDFWSPGDQITSTTTGIFRGFGCDNYDLTGVSVAGSDYYGLIVVDQNKDVRVQIREAGVGAVSETRSILGAQSDPIAVAIYAIPDPAATEPTFIFAAVALGAANTRVHYVEVSTFDGGALVPIWTSDGATRARQGTPVKITVAALISSYTTIGRLAVQETTANGDPYTTATDITNGGFVNPSEVLSKRNAIYSSMTELSGQLVLGQTAVESNFDRVKRSGLFLTGEPESETIVGADFVITEDADQEPVRIQVSDTNQMGDLLVVGYQVETGVLEPGPIPADEGLTATRILTLDTQSRPNAPASLQKVVISAHAGYPRAYDGRNPFEQAWHELPHILVVAQDETPGSIQPGNYEIAVTWESYDAQNNFYRSQPDFSESLEIVGVDVSIGVIFHTIQRTERTTVRAVVWRTLVNGSAFKKAAVVDAKVETTVVDTIVVMLSEGDTTIASNEELLLGIRPSQPTRITDFILSADGRFFGPDPERMSLVRFTVPASEGNAPHWPLVQGLEVETSRAVTAGAAMDGRIIFFTSTEAHTVGAGGPAANGVGAYSIPRLIPSSTGCSAHPTVALTPDGLVYGTGFDRIGSPHILTRALVTQEYADQVYAPYEIDGEVVRAAIWRPNERTTTLINGPGARTLVMSPETLRWTEETGKVALDVALADNRNVAWLLEDGRILIEPSGNSLGLDGAIGYQMLVSTPWIHWPTKDAITHTGCNFHGCQVYGTYQGSHDLQLRVYFDYEDTPRYTLLKPAADVDANNAAGLPYLYHFLLMSAEFCFAVRIEWSDNSEAAPTALIEAIDVELIGTGDTKPARLDNALYLKDAP